MVYEFVYIVRYFNRWFQWKSQRTERNFSAPQSYAWTNKCVCAFADGNARASANNGTWGTERLSAMGEKLNENKKSSRRIHNGPKVQRKDGECTGKHLCAREQEQNTCVSGTNNDRLGILESEWRHAASNHMNAVQFSIQCKQFTHTHAKFECCDYSEDKDTNTRKRSSVAMEWRCVTEKECTRRPVQKQGEIAALFFQHRYIQQLA